MDLVLEVTHGTSETAAASGVCDVGSMSGACDDVAHGVGDRTPRGASTREDAGGIGCVGASARLGTPPGEPIAGEWVEAPHGLPLPQRVQAGEITPMEIGVSLVRKSKEVSSIQGFHSTKGKDDSSKKTC